MEIDSPDISITPERVAELVRPGDEIAELSAHVDAATARLLDLIRVFDARAGWSNGLRSCAAWLSWRVGLGLGAARVEKVRVARALGTLPRLSGALASSELSYSKVRALTPVATPDTEERLLAVGRAGATEHVERIVRGWRRVDRIAENLEATRQHKRRELHVYPDQDGMCVVRGRLTPEVGGLLLRALDVRYDAVREQIRVEDVPSIGRAAGGCLGAPRGDGAPSWSRSRCTGRTLSGGGSRRRRRPRRSGSAGAVGARRRRTLLSKSSCSVAGTTVPFTRRAFRSIDSRTARRSSGGPTASSYPRCRLRPRCPLILHKSSAPNTSHRDCACTHERHARAGRGSGSM